MSKQTCFLSIDMDFFNGCCNPSEEAGAYLRNLLTRLKKKRTPIYATMNHQQVLPYLRECLGKTNTLVNVDEHSDLSIGRENRVTCGDWVDWAPKWVSRYIWVNDNRDLRDGDCSGALDFFSSHPSSRRRHYPEHLQSIQCLRRATIPRTFVENAVCCTLTMSPEFSMYELIYLFRKLVTEFSLPYKKGRVKNG